MSLRQDIVQAISNLEFSHRAGQTNYSEAGKQACTANVHWPSSPKKTNCRYTAWNLAHNICEHGYQLISAARRRHNGHVIRRTWPLHTVHCCTCVAVCMWRKIRGHVASLIDRPWPAVAVPRARDSVHVREAYYKIKERHDTKQNTIY